MKEPGYEQLTLFREASHANLVVQPGSDEARRTTVTSGRKCCALSKNSGPLGSLVKMLLGSSTWRSTRCYLTWKPLATPSKRLLFQLAASTPRTEGIESLSWPTPTAMDAKGLDKHPRKDMTSTRSCLLSQKVALFPTPKAQNSRGNGERHGEGGQSLDVSVGGRLNPTWVEWLMGFPIGWTDLKASETP